MSGSGGSSGGGTTVQSTNSSPWGGQQPYLSDIFGRAGGGEYKQSGNGQYEWYMPEKARIEEGLVNKPLQYYQGQTYASPSTETQQALDLQAQRALSGSPLTSAGQQELTKTLGGEYLQANPAIGYLESTAKGEMLGANPYLDEAFDRAGGRMAGLLGGQFSGSGRYGSGMHQAATADALSGLANQMYGGQYANERALQQQAAGQIGSMYGDERTKQMQGMMFAPQMAQQDYADIARLGEVGGAREDIVQQGINEDIQRQQFLNDEEWNRLARYQGLISGQFGGTSSGTTTTPTGRGSSVGAGLLGGAATGGGIGYMIGGAPGAAIGALGGAGLSLF